MFSPRVRAQYGVKRPRPLRRARQTVSPATRPWLDLVHAAGEPASRERRGGGRGRDAGVAARVAAGHADVGRRDGHVSRSPSVHAHAAAHARPRGSQAGHEREGRAASRAAETWTRGKRHRPRLSPKRSTAACQNCGRAASWTTTEKTMSSPARSPPKIWRGQCSNARSPWSRPAPWPRPRLSRRRSTIERTATHVEGGLRVVRHAGRRAADPSDSSHARRASPESAALAPRLRAARVALLARGSQRHPPAAAVTTRVRLRRALRRGRGRTTLSGIANSGMSTRALYVRVRRGRSCR